MSELTIEQQDAAAREAVAQLRREITKADADTMRLLLTEARTHYGWQDRDVPDAKLHEIYDLMKWGPTSMNQQPARYVYVRSKEAKEKLAPHLSEANVPKMMTAPVTAIICMDMMFYDKLSKTFPVKADARENFAKNEELARANAVRNGTLQGAYFMIAARAVGLDVGPMSGFNNKAVDEAFLTGTSWKSNFLCNLGYADESRIFRRLPRLAFDEVSKII